MYDRLRLPFGLLGEISPLERVGEAESLEERYPFSGGRDTGLQVVVGPGTGGFCSLVGLTEMRPFTEVKAGAKDSAFFSFSP